MKSRAALSLLGACWLAACSFPDYGFEPEPTEPPLASICADGLTSEAETGIDCGGGCAPCGVGEPCLVADDCVTQACFDGMCREPTCTDEVKNGAESDRDCGGQCDACLTGQDCGVHEDCESRVCTEGLCRAPECTDGVANGSETSEDCGGVCPPCADGAACLEDDDCESNKCSEMICVSPRCTDGVKNDVETDIDCGGGSCGPCMPEQACLEGSDCDSLVCDASDHCATPACDDETLNGSESDLDCGGPDCLGCNVLEKCEGPDDCISSTCQSGLCVPAEATGAELSRENWSASALLTHMNDLPADAIDASSASGYWSSGAFQEVGMYFEVDLGMPRVFFSIEFECPVDNDYARKFDVYCSSDGDFSDEEPVQADLPGLFPLTRVEFATAQVARYVRIQITESAPSWWCIDDLRIYR
ncbi:MAG TPA: discoidin domain-containing protein [Polyangiaceae bacterium]|nr:discoidin domain-containing protein [Polyangiaceae bacterium]